MRYTDVLDLEMVRLGLAFDPSHYELASALSDGQNSIDDVDGVVRVARRLDLEGEFARPTGGCYEARGRIDGQLQSHRQ